MTPQEQENYLADMEVQYQRMKGAIPVPAVGYYYSILRQLIIDDPERMILAIAKAKRVLDPILRKEAQQQNSSNEWKLTAKDVNDLFDELYS